MMEPLTQADPASIGGYELRARLGAGGFGQVFLGLSPGGRAVAVKVLQGEGAGSEDFLRRFRLEVSAAQRVSGIYTAPVVAAGLDQRPPWVATAFVPGPTLAQMIAEHGPLPEPALWRLLAGLTEALQAIHACGLVHRDLKPANVMLAADGPRVIDFGISKVAGGSTLTTGNMIFGTPGYIAPEQASGDPVGPPTDVFALGCVLAYAATGESPFAGGAAAAVLYRVVHADPVLGPMPPAVRAVVQRCLAKEPATRPSLAELAAIGRDGPTPDARRSPTSFWPRQTARIIRDYEEEADAEPTAPGQRRSPVSPPPRAVTPAGPGQAYPAAAPDRGYPPTDRQRAQPPADPDQADPAATVRTAVLLMRAGAALSGVTALLTGIDNGIILTGSATGQGPPSPIYGVVALVLWLAVAAGVRRASRLARVAGPVLFTLFTLDLLNSLTSSSGGSLVAVALITLTWLAGGAASVLLWLPSAGCYFRRRRPGRA